MSNSTLHQLPQVEPSRITNSAENPSAPEIQALATPARNPDQRQHQNLQEDSDSFSRTTKDKPTKLLLKTLPTSPSQKLATSKTANLQGKITQAQPNDLQITGKAFPPTSSSSSTISTNQNSPTWTTTHDLRPKVHGKANKHATNKDPSVNKKRKKLKNINFSTYFTTPTTLPRPSEPHSNSNSLHSLSEEEFLSPNSLHNSPTNLHKPSKPSWYPKYYSNAQRTKLLRSYYSHLKVIVQEYSSAYSQHESQVALQEYYNHQITEFEPTYIPPETYYFPISSYFSENPPTIYNTETLIDADIYMDHLLDWYQPHFNPELFIHETIETPQEMSARLLSPSNFQSAEIMRAWLSTYQQGHCSHPSTPDPSRTVYFNPQKPPLIRGKKYAPRPP